MLDKKFKQSTDLELKGVNELVARTMLDYIYTGKTTRLTTSFTTWEDAIKLFQTANFYDLSELCQTTIHIIEKYLTVHNVSATLKLATACSVPQLIEVAKTFIGANLQSYLATLSDHLSDRLLNLAVPVKRKRGSLSDDDEDPTPHSKRKRS